MRYSFYKFLLFLLFSLIYNPAFSVYILDYSRPIFFNDQVETFNNRLYIEISSLLSISNSGQERKFILLANHPRENTFSDESIYESMIKASGGGSEISFILGLSDTRSILSRRFSSTSTDPKLFRQCNKTNFNQPIFEPLTIDTEKLSEIKSLNDFILAGKNKKPIVGLATYWIGDTKATIDFTLKVLNINPATVTGKQVDQNLLWQAVSSRAPLYLPNITDSIDDCPPIYEGHIAMRSFSGPLYFVYLCPSSNDFQCTASFDGSVRFFIRD